MKTKNLLLIVVAVLVALSVWSCASTKSQKETGSLVYGYINANNVENLSTGSSVQIQILPMEYDAFPQDVGGAIKTNIVPPMSEAERWTYVGVVLEKTGVFTLINLEPGEYYIESISTIIDSGASQVKITYPFEKPVIGEGIIIENGSVIYAGAFDVIANKGITLSQISQEQVVEKVKESLEKQGWDKDFNVELPKK